MHSIQSFFKMSPQKALGWENAKGRNDIWRSKTCCCQPWSCMHSFIWWIAGQVCAQQRHIKHMCISYILPCDAVWPVCVAWVNLFLCNPVLTGSLMEFGRKSVPVCVCVGGGGHRRVWKKGQEGRWGGGRRDFWEEKGRQKQVREKNIIYGTHRFKTQA